jgi:hypothetical protein
MATMFQTRSDPDEMRARAGVSIEEKEYRI